MESRITEVNIAVQLRGLNFAPEMWFLQKGRGQFLAFFLEAILFPLTKMFLFSKLLLKKMKRNKL